MSEPTHEDLHDLTVAVEGVSYELEAVNQTLRELLGVLAVGAYLDAVPSWVNRGEESSERLAEPGELELAELSLRQEQDAGRAAGYVVFATFIGTLLIAALVLYAIS